MPIYIDIPVGSYHFDRAIVEDRRFNERNRGIGVTWQDGKRQTMLGFYKNSLSRNSYYAAHGVVRNMGGFSVGAIGGAVTGYKSSAVPLIAATAAYQQGLYGISVIAAPTARVFGLINYGFIGAQFRYKIK